MSNDPQPARVSRRRSRRRWPTYAVFVLVAITSLWVWLGVLVHRARSQRLAVQAITDLGGRVYYEYQVNEKYHIYYLEADAPCPHPTWVKELLGEDIFSRVELVDLRSQASVRDADLAALRHFPSLKFVDLTLIPTISADGLAHLRSLNHLERLFLTSPKVTAAGLVHLRELPRLEVLWLVQAQIADGDLSHLIGLPNLELLVVSSEQISSQGAKAFAKRRPRCEVVRLPTPPRGELKAELGIP